MDPVLLSRIQFALTVGFHFIFPPITIGLAWIIVWIMSVYKRTGSELYRDMARFWTKVFGLTFAVGVATGITMEFQFGTNWAGYSRFVGDIFGAPLAAEAVIAFFLESTFLAVLLLGWNTVSKGVHWFAALMVAVGSTLSAFWILVANSWQQTPAGFHMVNGRAELTSFAQAVFNPSTGPRFLHTVDGALVTGAFVMMGISALLLIKNRGGEVAKRSLKIALVVGFTASVAQVPLGHVHAVQVAHTQPAKLAAIEGLFKTRPHAPMIAFCIPREDKGESTCRVEVPSMLSFMIYGRGDAVVKGLNDFPRSEWPPVAPTFYTFHVMVGLGMLFIALTGVGIVLLWWKKLPATKAFLWAAVVAGPLPIIANELGWVTAEVGRQPWIVYNLLKTSDAISVTVPAGQILFTIIAFSVVYALLLGAWIIVLKREMARCPSGAADIPAKKAVRV